MATLYGYADPAEQAAMVLDRVRVDAYARAIAATVRPGDVVLDLGTGTGLLAMLAARAGARRVFAVERTGAIALARELITANQLGDVVELIRADVTELDALPEPPRVIVSETLGHFAPAEQLHRLFRHARRLARADAVVIPAAYRLVFAAARPRGLAADVDALRVCHGLTLAALAARLLARVGYARLTAAELVGPETTGAAIAVDAPLPAVLTGTAPVAVAGPVTAIAVSFVATLAAGVELSSAIGATATHWVQAVFPIEPPLEVAAGAVLEVELVPRLAFASNSWAWTVRAGAEVRRGDAVDALVGEQADLLAQLGRRRPGPIPAPPPLRAWAAALGATPPELLDVEELTDRLCAAMPVVFADRDQARQEVLALVQALDRAG
ncbi:MAG: class I SAM-dependent methyltransferase [Kofleriaceae bacterium]